MTLCCNVNAGMLREPITVQSRTRVSDGAGGWTDTWGIVQGAPRRASVKFLGGSERWASHRTEGVARMKFTMRYKSTVTEKDRIVMRGRAYNIRAIDNLEMANQWMEVYTDQGYAI